MRRLEVSQALMDYINADGQVEMKAEERNLYIRQPRPNELLIDLDSQEDLERCQVAIDIAMELNIFGNDLQIEDVDTLQSSTEGHYHVIVQLSRAVTPKKRVYMQALFGSDIKREVLALASINAERKYISILFRPK
jgi:hypothetical protein